MINRSCMFNLFISLFLICANAAFANSDYTAAKRIKIMTNDFSIMLPINTTFSKTSEGELNQYTFTLPAISPKILFVPFVVSVFPADSLTSQTITDRFLADFVNNQQEVYGIAPEATDAIEHRIQALNLNDRSYRTYKYESGRSLIMWSLFTEKTKTYIVTGFLSQDAPAPISEIFYQQVLTSIMPK